MIRTTLEDAQSHLPDLIEAAVRGEQIVRLVPVASERPCPRFGSAKGFFEMSEDFDAPLPDFDEYQ